VKSIKGGEQLPELLSGTESQVYADSAYASEKTNEWLADKKIENRVLERAYRNKPLQPAQKKQNKIKSRIRSTVERVFGILKLHYGMAQARYLGKARNQMRFNLICVAYNIKRGISLRKEIQQTQESYA
jgi:IS5 family transposase